MTFHHLKREQKTSRRTGQSRGNFLFDWCLVQIFAGTPAFLSEGFRGFHQSIQANAVIIPALGYDRLLPNLFQFLIQQ
jgi:hypothetical protein